FAGSTSPMSLCASPISADRHSISDGKCHVSAGRPTGSAGRPVFAGKPTGFAGRPVSAGKPTGSAGRPISVGRPSGSATRTPVPAGHIHDGLNIFDCPKSGIFTSSSYDKELVAQGHRQEEGIDYTDVFSPVAKIEAIRLFLAFASFMGFMVYQMDVKSAFLYGKIAEEVYDTQPRGFKDPDNPKKV
nr:putative ribonuclease H-like domain-containing protein [Tanacetum cinerariifolium]